MSLKLNASKVRHLVMLLFKGKRGNRLISNFTRTSADLAQPRQTGDKGVRACRFARR